MTLEEPSQNFLLDSFNETRNTTLQLVKNLERDDFGVQTAVFMSPPKWHIGHVSWLNEIVLSKTQPNYEFFSDELSEYLNSYYNQFGKPYDKSKRGVMSRPTVDEILQYFDVITNKVREVISKPLEKETAYLFTMAINHECQHQELLVYDLQHLLGDQYRPAKINEPVVSSNKEKKAIKVNGGLYNLGYSGNDYCYDIELPEHKTYLNDYQIDNFLTSNSEYLEFMNEGGYEDYSFWLSDGWDAVKKNEWNSPMYWEKDRDDWITRDFAGKRKINPNEPVCHVSFYEAAAYCKWANKRLPTEAEWEKAALWNDKKEIKTIFPWGNEKPTESHANLLESNIWNCSNVGAYENGKSNYGCYQMIGDVWEWTSSEFIGYPGFKSGFDEYNDKWFTNQKVLRGGSFGTPSKSIRGSYRNFFRLDERWLISGFRCVEDI
ncbi:ergothioneine biosynthesis protein EgtB [Candidatus Nitrosopelagicus sp.]|nr:ergothioneine biosynthesis protein EgtB [Candidatus Nitrosopelagicus sp.]